MSTLLCGAMSIVELLERWCACRPRGCGMRQRLDEMYRFSPGSAASKPAVAHLPNTLTSDIFLSSLLIETLQGERLLCGRFLKRSPTRKTTIPFLYAKQA